MRLRDARGGILAGAKCARAECSSAAAAANTPAAERGGIAADGEACREPTACVRDEESDRPKRRTRRRDDDDDEDEPRRRPTPKKSGAPIILLVVGGIMLGCCGIGGYGIYVAVNRVKQVAEDVRDRIATMNPRVSRGSYEQLHLHASIAEAERTLGPGLPANAEAIEKVFPPGSPKIAEWKRQADNGRVMLWQNGEDYLLVCFHPKLDSTGKLQAKVWEPANHASSATAGTLDDAQYLELFKLAGKVPPPDTPDEGDLKVSAETLVREYRADPFRADSRYSGKTLHVSGAVSDVILKGTEVVVLLEGLKGDTKKDAIRRIYCAMTKPAESMAWSLSRGQEVTIRGTAQAPLGEVLSVTGCMIESRKADPAVQVLATNLVNDFTKDPVAAEVRYKGKQLKLIAAVVEKSHADGLLLVSPIKSMQKVKIEAEIGAEVRGQLETVKPGGRVAVKGEFFKFADGIIYLNRCWLVP